MQHAPREFVVGLLMGVVAVVTESVACGQLPQTRLQALFPAGAQAGQTVEATVTSGTDLEGVNRLHFNHPGIAATQKTQMLNDKPQPVDKVFTITVASEVPPGFYEVRASGPLGMSNPRFFHISNSPEFTETEPNNTPDQANPVELNRMLNGRMNAAVDVDWFKFTGKQGQRILAECYANRIDSKLDATLELYDSNGRRLISARNNLPRDALLDITLPADGDYRLKVFDFTYQGGEDYFYRLQLTTGPHLDFIFPPAGVPGTTAKFTLFGRNLPGGQPSGVSLGGKSLESLPV